MKPLHWKLVGMATLWLAALVINRPELALAQAAAQRNSSAPVLQTAPPPIDDYWQVIDDALAAMRQVEREPLLPPSTRAARLAEMAAQLEAITAVTLADGQIAPVDNAALVAALRAENPDQAHLAARLEALAQTRRLWPERAAHPGTFDKLAAVLARPEFQPAAERKPTWLENWWLEFTDWLDRQLARLLFSNQAQALGIDWAVLIVGAAVLAGVAYFFVRSVRANLVREATLAGETAELNWSASTAAQQARVLAASADYRQAIRYMYLAALLTLDERGVLRYDKALTNRETLRHAEQAADSQLAQTMSPVVDTFDRVWYGFAPVDDETYQAYTELVKQVTRTRREA